MTFCNQFKQRFFKGQIDWENDDIRVALLKSTANVQAADIDAATLDDLFSGALAANLYDGSPARVATTGRLVAVQNNELHLRLDTTTFEALTNPNDTAVRKMLVYKHVTDDSDSIPINFVAWNADQTPADGEDFLIPWTNSRIGKLANTSGVTDAYWYDAAFKGFAKGQIDWENDTFKALFIRDPNATGYNPAADLTPDTLGEFFSNMGVANTAEFDGTYTRPTLTGNAVADPNADEICRLTANNVNFTALNLGASQYGIAGVLVYKHITNDASSIPLCYLKYGSTKTPDGGPFQINFASGVTLKTLGD